VRNREQFGAANRFPRGGTGGDAKGRRRKNLLKKIAMQCSMAYAIA